MFSKSPLKEDVAIAGSDALFVLLYVTVIELMDWLALTELVVVAVYDLGTVVAYTTPL